MNVRAFLVMAIVASCGASVTKSQYVDGVNAPSIHPDHAMLTVCKCEGKERPPTVKERRAAVSFQVITMMCEGRTYDCKLVEPEVPTWPWPTLHLTPEKFPLPPLK